MSLLVPRQVAQERLVEQVNAEVDRQIENARMLERELKSIDYNLSLVLASEQADLEEFEYPGYWYIRKRIPGGFDALIPLAGENGERLEPGLWVLDWLKAADLWNPRVHLSKQEAREKLRQAKVRRKQLESEQRQDEGVLTIKAAKRVSGDGGMTRRQWGRGGPAGKQLVLPPGVEL